MATITPNPNWNLLIALKSLLGAFTLQKKMSLKGLSIPDANPLLPGHMSSL